MPEESNIFPKYLENIITGCSNVNVVSVLGIPDDRHGQVGVAFLQLNEDTPQVRLSVEQFCREHLAKFQVPKYFIYMRDSDWPRTATGKIPKYRLQEMAKEQIKTAK